MLIEWREATAGIGGVLFVMAAFYLLILPRGERFSRRAWPAWAVIVLFVGAVLWSMWSETLRPIIEAGDPVRAAGTVLGLAAFILAMLVITYGGFQVVAGILKAMHEETFARNAEIIRAGKEHYQPEIVRAARQENLIAILRAARPGCLWMALAFALLALGGWLGK